MVGIQSRPSESHMLHLNPVRQQSRDNTQNIMAINDIPNR